MGTTIMQKTGQVEKTVDREFAEEEGRYRTYVDLPTLATPHVLVHPQKSVLQTGKLIIRMEKEVGNLQRDAKTYLDALRCK